MSIVDFLAEKTHLKTWFVELSTAVKEASSGKKSVLLLLEIGNQSWRQWVVESLEASRFINTSLFFLDFDFSW